MDSFITIKSILTTKFEVEMMQDLNGRYCIRYKARGQYKYSEWLTDYLMASFLFDLKVQELEGQ